MRKTSLILLFLMSIIVTSVTAQVGETYYVGTRSARVRSEANTTSATIVTLTPGTAVTVLEVVVGAAVNGSTSWYRIEVNGQSGHIHSSLVTNTAPSTSTTTTTTGTGYAVSVRSASLRAEPNTSSSIVARLRRGTRVNVLEQVEGEKINGSTLWYRVETNGQTGYVHNSLVSSGVSTIVVSGGSSSIQEGGWSFKRYQPPTVTGNCVWSPTSPQPDWYDDHYNITVSNSGRTITLRDGKLCEAVEMSLVSEATYSGSGPRKNSVGGVCTLDLTFTSATTVTGTFTDKVGCHFAFRLEGTHD